MRKFPAACRDDIDFRRAFLDGTCKVEINSFYALVTTLCTDDTHFHRVIYICFVALSSCSTGQL